MPPNALRLGPDMPDEIVDEIFNLLVSRRDSSTLAALKSCSLASKRLLRFARSRMFTSLEVGRTSQARRTVSSGTQARERVTFFVENPHLIPYIRTLVVYGDFVRRCQAINDIDDIFWTSIASLHTLSLQRILWPFLKPTVQKSLLRVDAVELTLTEFGIDPKCGFLCTFPSLRSLSVASLKHRRIPEHSVEETRLKGARPAELCIEFGPEANHLLHPSLDLTGVAHMQLTLRL